MPQVAPTPQCILAADHQDAFLTLCGVGPPLDRQDLRRIADIKNLILDALLHAMPSLKGATPGILIDEALGEEAALRAKDRGLLLAMPVDRGPPTVFDFEFGSEWREHVERFDPNFVKAMVTLNPEGPIDTNRVQLERLHALSEWLDSRGYALMLEILVPGTDAQLAQFASVEEYDEMLRPHLVTIAMQHMHEAEIRPDIWKVEGTSTREHAEMIVAAARSGGRRHVNCLLLGRGEGDEKVDAWIRGVAGVDGFGGFAIGRSIWTHALEGFLSGSLTRDNAVAAISSRYLHFANNYRAAAMT